MRYECLPLGLNVSICDEGFNAKLRAVPTCIAAIRPYK